MSSQIRRRLAALAIGLAATSAAAVPAWDVWPTTDGGVRINQAADGGVRINQAGSDLEPQDREL